MRLQIAAGSVILVALRDSGGRQAVAPAGPESPARCPPVV